ncbi:MAG: 2-oxoacid:ferredoxin oxidoreductase subunit beta [Acidobacteriota bacterium]
MNAPAPLKAKDFETDQTVRWCPGCGDYAILKSVQSVFPSLGIPRENFVVVSGIGCAARFPYYMNTFGFHTIHGRAPAIATGIKVANPELSVWVASGDGDSLSIGGNHFIHTLRRNVGLKHLMFNNRIYGLTKGQVSPTSERGKRTKSSPWGSVDAPFNPFQVALGAGATFVARGIDVQAPMLRAVLGRAAQHEGTAFVEILQNCNIFNDGAWKSLTEKDVRAECQLLLEHGKPMIFGKDQDKGLRLNGLSLEVINLADHDESEVLVHDETNLNLAWLLAQMQAPAFPTPVGVIRAVEAPTHEAQLTAQLEHAVENKGKGSLHDLLNAGDTWTV